MANIYGSKNSADAKAAKSFLHDLTFVAGFRSSDQRTNGVIDFPVAYANEATALCNEVINRSFNDIDSDIIRISGVNIKDRLTARGRYKSWSAPEIAKALVFLAECLGVYWDDTNATTYEVDAFKNTLLGKEVEAYGRFVSDLQAVQAAAPKSAPVGTTRQRRSSTGTSGSTNKYKPVGAQSSNVRDLQGLPGNKMLADGPHVYRIIGTNANSNNISTAFIKPLSASGAKGSTNKVFVSSGHGYTDCVCWFDDINDATEFLNKILNSNSMKSNISNLQLSKCNADPNGYFLVGTEFGTCAISAKKLNEALEEDVANSEDCNACASEPIDEDNGWERVGARITKEEYEALTQNMMKY